MTKDFFAALKEARDFLLEQEKVNIISHYDADGLCAAAILAKTCKRSNIDFNVKIIKQLYKESIEEIKKMEGSFVFADLGSGQIDLIRNNFSNFLILDHHQTVSKLETSHINPYFFSIDGNIDISGSGLSYLLAKEISIRNKDLSSLAIVGSVGDMQDFSGRLQGLNRLILSDAVDSKLIEATNDLRLYGRVSRPLVQFLEYSTNPILPGLTANEKACIRFLNKLGIELKNNGRWRSYSDLTIEEKKTFVSSLIVYLTEKNFPEFRIKELFGEVYTLLNESSNSPLRDAKEFATLCNSCGRHSKADLALAVCMGDREESYSKAISLLTQHRKELREGLKFIKDKGLVEYEKFYFIDAENSVRDSLIGIIVGMLYSSSLLPENKPIIAMAYYEDGSVKVSARATKYLIDKGLNLGRILKEICSEISDATDGGGHKIAAGCKIKKENKELFIKLLNEKLSKFF
ncbi:MAG: DHH family phosphoesterase [Candidatus Diapherotrites archaeon]|nr:DHH family phosphoesterase [Candidatus Diapherotrites archaeon]